MHLELAPPKPGAEAVEGKEQPVDQRLEPGRATGHEDVDRQDVADPARRAVASQEYPTPQARVPTATTSFGVGIAP